MANPVVEVWLRAPRLAWKNDGGPVPRGFRSFVKRTGGLKRRRLTNERKEIVGRGQWVVRVGGSTFVFSTAEMKRLYSRVPL